MAALGIVQDGDPVLRQTARQFDLPAEAEDARRVIAELHSGIERVQTAHTFGKGVGVAAPQLNINRAAALVRTPDGDTITLLNRQITRFDRGVARLVAHEIDHLEGVLYTDRMADEVDPIPVSEYRQGGQQWTYTAGR